VDILFIHQNMPGQFRHLAPALALRPGTRVFFLTQRQGIDLPGVHRATYPRPEGPGDRTHQYLRTFEGAIRSGQAVARAMLALKRQGVDPAVVVGHPGWGETLFVREIFPRAAILSFAEFYYSAHGADVGFDPQVPVPLDTACRTRARNAHLLLALEACDRAMAPTEWQRSRHPAPFRPRIHRIFDGIDTRTVVPDPAAAFALPSGRVLSRSTEIVTYVARNFEPYRGFPSFVRALPHLLAMRPAAEVVLVGGDEVSYGAAPPGGGTWRAALLAEIDLAPFAGRIHWLGRIPFAEYLRLLQVSAAHCYLTVPFVLSWSAVEAMAAGCTLVASDTAPLHELVVPGVNGHLVPFFDPPAIAAGLAAALDARDTPAGLRLRAAARETVLAEWSLERCLPRQLALVDECAELPLRQ
jgi:glycosyltransferase involved in cell wall biosynthesis